MKDLLYLNNILESIRILKDYIKNKEVSDLENSVLLRDGVSKRIEEIGENMGKVSESTKKKFKEVKWQDFIDARHFLAHVYQMVNVNKLWNILTKEIPELETQIKKAIQWAKQ
jgi:uncharacterized protein with HEPN domain